MKKQLSAILCLSLLILTACGMVSEEKSTTSTAPRSDASPQALEVQYSDSGFASAPVQADADMYAMDTVMHFRVYGADQKETKQAIEKAVAEITRLDQLMSTNDPNSELAQLNREGRGHFGKDNVYLLQRAKEINELTGGHFNIAVYPLVTLWGFTTDKQQVPSQAEIAERLPLTDPQDVQFKPENGEVAFAQKGMGLDLGGIAKGYASQRLMSIFAEEGVAGGLVSLGGNAQLYRQKPDGSDFIIGVQDPQNAEGYIGVIEAHDCAVITSGIYQRFFEEKGQRYHHIIDPATGAPADNTLASVTVVCQDGTTADALATALMIMGYDDAIAFWQAHADLFDMLLIDKENQVTVTQGLAERYTPQEGTTAEVVHRVP